MAKSQRIASCYSEENAENAGQLYDSIPPNLRFFIPTMQGGVIRGKSLYLQSVKMGALREPKLLKLEV